MTKRKILIIDDDPVMVKMLEHRLEANMYDVISAYDGEEGLGKVRKERPDLIILDLRLPTMSGYKVCALLKGHPIYKEIPIIMLTAMDEKLDMELGQVLGADAYITKPLEPDNLLSTINELIEK